MSVLDKALRVQNSPLTHYDEPSLRKIIAGLVQIIVTERKDHARELREIQRELES